MMQQWLTALLTLTTIALGKAVTFGTLPPRPTTGTILYYMFIL